MKKILIATKLDDIARNLFKEKGRYIVVQDDKADILTLAKAHPDTFGLIVRSEKVTQGVIDGLPSLKVIVRAGAGYNTIDTTYARKKGVDVMNTPGANANAVAEEVLALMLADARHLIKADPSVRAGKWEKKQFTGREISGKTIGIVGLGYIGRLVATRLSGFGVKIFGYDPMITEERAHEMDVELLDLPDLFAQCDYVTLHLPENEATKGMINGSLFSDMKAGATVINCARAGILVEDDLRLVRQEKGIRFLNDVYAKDEAGLKSVADIADIMLPHLGASTVEANENASRRAAIQLIEFVEKGISTHIVNRDIPEGLDETFADLAYMLMRLCRGVVGKQHKLKLIETSFYGTLKPFSDWLVIPIVAALSRGFDRSLDFRAAREYLRKQGIDYNTRDVDEDKGYENSTTIDLTAHIGAEELRVASVRGTITEGILMVSRINDFQKLYFEPRGHTVCFTYEDRPGILGLIAAALAQEKINIDDVRNPHDSKGNESIAILKVNQPVSDEVIEKIGKDIKAGMGFYSEL